MLRRFRARAFTLVEVLVAVAVLSIASLGVMGVLTYGVVAGSSAGDVSTANQYSREIIEHIRIDGASLIFTAGGPLAGLQSATESSRDALNAAPLDSAALHLPADSRFKRNVQILSWPGGGTSVNNTTAMVRIRLRIYWGGGDGAGQDGERMTETVALLRNS